MIRTEKAIRMSQSLRSEQDLLGSREVPARAYYGNSHLVGDGKFPDQRRHSDLCLSRPDQSAGLGEESRSPGQPRSEMLDAERTRAIVSACDEICRGALHDQAGNSVKGQLTAKFLADQLGMNLFVSKPEPRDGSASKRAA